MPCIKSRSRSSRISTFHPRLLSYRKRSIHPCLKETKSKIISFKSNSENFNRTVKCSHKLSLDKLSVSKNKTAKSVSCSSRPSDRCKRYHRATRKMKALRSRQLQHLLRQVLFLKFRARSKLLSQQLRSEKLKLSNILKN